MSTICFARAAQRWTSRICVHDLFTFQEVTPSSKTRNQLIHTPVPFQCSRDHLDERHTLSPLPQPTTAYRAPSPPDTPPSSPWSARRKPNARAWFGTHSPRERGAVHVLLLFCASGPLSYVLKAAIIAS